MPRTEETAVPAADQLGKAENRTAGGGRSRHWWYWAGGVAILAAQTPELYAATGPSAHEALLACTGLVLVFLGASSWRGDEEAGRDWLWCLLWAIWFVMLSSPASPSFVGRLWPSVVAAFRTDPAGTIWACGSLLAFLVAAATVGARTLRRRRAMASGR